MAEGGPTTVKNIMEQAAENAKTKAEVEKMTKKVIDQLVATGRMSKNNAAYGAAVIESYVTTKATNKGMSVKEVFKKMDFVIKKLETTLHDFGDATIEQEKVLEGTGQKVKVREKKQKVYDQKLKQKDIISKLRDCVNG
jgi:polyhydroxyalkanoate synthesis regulator phasin